jgi:hypothetical protein
MSEQNLSRIRDRWRAEISYLYGRPPTVGDVRGAIACPRPQADCASISAGLGGA